MIKKQKVMEEINTLLKDQMDCNKMNIIKILINDMEERSQLQMKRLIN